ncbi:hypothetical protein N7495_001523 [Penicillium taxi]|uniref:uncharacterized protein n=1 Tax=Penicillium taxi TaxID=168475 RepID=UPI00254530FB|nr:uncharacterized protein N7495_001523 [Penicillium taxi]KAJ5908841.1 hypothetical protein N7495_001523 [Penicillium taxi]
MISMNVNRVNITFGSALPDGHAVQFWSTVEHLKATGWPTFVIEVGYSEGLSQFRADGQKWFHDSLGEVRLVLLILIKPTLRRLKFELWQLAPVNAPRPLTRQYISALKATNQRPPMGQQLANQQPFCMQNVEVDTAQNGRNRVQGPLRLDCQALLDDPNPPTPNYFLGNMFFDFVTRDFWT